MTTSAGCWLKSNRHWSRSATSITCKILNRRSRLWKLPSSCSTLCLVRNSLILPSNCRIISMNFSLPCAGCLIPWLPGVKTYQPIWQPGSWPPPSIGNHPCSLAEKCSCHLGCFGSFSSQFVPGRIAPQLAAPLPHHSSWHAGLAVPFTPAFLEPPCLFQRQACWLQPFAVSRGRPCAFSR